MPSRTKRLQDSVFGVNLPPRLQIPLNNFLSSDPCTRWQTARDGEEIVELILEVSMFALARGVPMEVLAQEWFKVGTYKFQDDKSQVKTG